jgi:hypothetical protein
MHDALTTYFHGEKTAGLLLAGIGLVMVGGAAILFPARLELRPLAWTLGVCALVEIAVGVGLHLKTPSQVARLEAQLTSEPAAYYASETSRMERVQKTFVVIELVWIVLLGGSAVAAVALAHRPVVQGIALGLLIHAGALLAFDLVADRRGARDLEAIHAHGGSPESS